MNVDQTVAPMPTGMPGGKPPAFRGHAVRQSGRHDPRHVALV